MKNPNDYNLIILVNEEIDDTLTLKINESVESIPDTLTKRYPPMGPQASILLIGLSYCAVKIGEGFLTKIGEMAAEKALGDLMGTIKEAQKEPYIVTAGGIIKGATNGYSLHHSMMYDLNNGSNLKCIFKADWNMGQFNKAVIIFQKELRKHKKGLNNQISEIVQTKLPVSGLLLITIDLDNNSLVHVDIFNT